MVNNNMRNTNVNFVMVKMTLCLVFIEKKILYKSDVTFAASFHNVKYRTAINNLITISYLDYIILISFMVKVYFLDNMKN